MHPQKVKVKGFATSRNPNSSQYPQFCDYLRPNRNGSNSNEKGKGSLSRLEIMRQINQSKERLGTLMLNAT